jgi:NAD(P)-dependent dehydrogenase (short-subunit alcohol dehydrogenase family)
VSVLDRFSLKDRIALVTAGAGPQFGSSISKALAEAGATVITASRSLDTNLEFAQMLQQRGFEAFGMALDVGNPDSISELRDEVLARFGRIDVLVNNARAVIEGGFDVQDPEDWIECAKGDMAGLFALTKAFLPGMIRQKRGSVINISSIYGVVGNDPTLYVGTEMLDQQSPAYSFSKGGMVNATRYLAAFYGKANVRFNSISPGGFFNHQPESFVERYCDRVPLGRMMGDQDVQGAVIFLASDASAYVTGINLMVDGGWTAI